MELSACALRNLLAEGRLSASELLDATLERADRLDPRLRSFVQVLEDRSRVAASESDRRLQSGAGRRLEGLPLTIKDSLWLAGVEAADGSRARSGFVAPATDLAVQRAEDAGAVIFAKTANPEFCLFGYTSSERNGASANPWDLSRTPGGSSGGAAAALAARVGPLALGSDGGGSLRIPAAFCGVAAHKPTHGLVPYWPDVPAWPTLSVIGPMARHVGDLELLFDVIVGHDAADPFSVPAQPRSATRRGLAGLRIAVDLDRGGVVPIEPDVRAAFEALLAELRSAGVTFAPDVLARRDSGVREWLEIATTDASAAYALELARAPALLGEDSRAFLAYAERVSGRELAAAQRARVQIATAYVELFGQSGAAVLLSPALGLEAFALDTPCPAEVAGVPIERPYDDWQGHLWDANLAGLPACVIPMGLGDEGLPLGLQITGPKFSDREVLTIAHAIEELLALELRPPLG
jgi:Asp-tRNA(Asn)/Glu-tRNA(Gln) amidotransferase A subunit family amidase